MSIPQNAGELVDSTPLRNDIAALREQAHTEGYLFFRGLIPREDVLALRQTLLKVVDQFGWRASGQDPLGGLLNLTALNQTPEADMRLDIGVSHAAYHQVQRLESVHAFPHHPKLLALYRDLFEDDVLVHPRHIVRMITAHHGMNPTPPHQDFPLIQGTTNTWTCWMPIGDCPRAMGGLSVLPRTHRKGYLPIQPAVGAGGLEAQLCPHEVDWVTTDFAAGDVLTFTCHTVHGALPNRRREQIRLSLDVRYQPASEQIEAKSLLPHCPLSWEEIYAGWQSDQFQYYWRKYDAELSAWDETLQQPSRRIC